MNTAINLTSRASLIRAIKPGVIIRVLEHWQEYLRGTERTPKVIRNSGKSGIQTNGYYFDGQRPKDHWKDGPHTEMETVEMWADIPAASKLRFNPDGSVTFYPDTDRSWTLAFYEPSSVMAA